LNTDTFLNIGVESKYGSNTHRINARVPPSSCVFTEILGIGHEPIEYINYK